MNEKKRMNHGLREVAFTKQPDGGESIYSFATFALLRKISPSLLPPQVPTVTVHWPQRPTVQSTQVQVAVSCGPKDQGTVASATLGVSISVACQRPQLSQMQRKAMVRPRRQDVHNFFWPKTLPVAASIAIRTFITLNALVLRGVQSLRNRKFVDCDGRISRCVSKSNEPRQPMIGNWL
jgi:hypothetical protein